MPDRRLWSEKNIQYTLIHVKFKNREKYIVLEIRVMDTVKKKGRSSNQAGTKRKIMRY